MSKPLNIEIKESMEELRGDLKTVIPFIRPRIIMLIQMKKHGSLARRSLAEVSGVSPGSIQRWRETYISGGIAALITHSYKESVSQLSGEEERQFLSEISNNPENGVQGYAELRKRMKERFGKEKRT